MGSGFRVWTAGEVVSASNVNNYLQEQTVMSFAGTAARSSAIASPEEGMLSYLQDTDTYQGYNGTSWVNLNTLAGTDSSGLQHINTTSFTSVASQSLNNVFSSTYDNYLVVIDGLTGSTTMTVDLRLRVSGVDSSTQYYWGIALTNASATSIPAGGNNVGSYRLFNAVAAERGFINLNINNPNLAKISLFNGSLTGEFSGSIGGGASGGLHNVATAYDGFTIIASTGTISGRVQVYGYRK